PNVAPPSPPKPKRKYPVTISSADIPKFHGSASSWSRFETRFEEDIGDNPHCSETKNVDLLADAIPSHRQIILSYSSYKDALKSLKELFADKLAVKKEILQIARETPNLPDDPQVAH